ncbi:hypothetical protein [Pseudomonas sp. NMS19W]|uniref:hypothetical protein n=1 Tax=Pseudomonas sp. NMS19W TaxID=3079768 RepID=UPI003F658016
MDMKMICLTPLLLSLSLQTATADTAILPDGQVAIDPVQGPSETKAVEVRAEVWNKSQVAIKVIQPGVAPQTLEPAESYQSQTYPDAPISIQLPENSAIKYITVTAKKGACKAPICIYVQ